MRQPLVVSYGMGVDSTAMLVGMSRLGIRPDLILFADTMAEKGETYAYLATMNAWCDKVGFPRVQVVTYTVKDFKNWPPYFGLEENCLTNGTLPSEAFGFGSCSEKWKQQPQNRHTKEWAPAIECWARGGKVRKAIGYDASPADEKRACAAKRTFKVNGDDPLYEYWYPLQEWGWNRLRCIQEIAKEGLPVPLKSSCFMCPNMKKDEVLALPREKLQRLVILEARAKPRLEGHMTQAELDQSFERKSKAWEEKAAKAKKEGKPEPARKPRRKIQGERGLIRGLWRAKMMTDFIREQGLLPGAEVDRLASSVPAELIRRNEAHAAGRKVESWGEFYARVGVGN